MSLPATQRHGFCGSEKDSIVIRPSLQHSVRGRDGGAPGRSLPARYRDCASVPSPDSSASAEGASAEGASVEGASVEGVSRPP